MNIPRIITITIIAITAITSFLAFSNRDLMRKFIFNPYTAYHEKQYYRFLSHGFIHADWAHLIFNMVTFYFFAERVLVEFNSVWLFLAFYLSAIIVASSRTFFKYKNQPEYNSLGASGGVSAILMASVLFDPTTKLIIFPIPIGIPGYVFALFYLAYSQFMSKWSLDNINHDAHLLGAVYGILFPIIIRPGVVVSFFNQLFT